MAFFRNLSLRKKIIVAFLGIGLLPLLALAYSNLYITQVALRNEAQRNLFNVTAQSAGYVDYWVITQQESIYQDARLPDILTLMSAHAVGDADQQKMENAHILLKTLAAKQPAYITSYALLDRNGNVVLDTNERQIGQNKADRPYFSVFVTPHQTEAHAGHDHGEDTDGHDSHTESETTETISAAGMPDSYLSPLIFSPETGNPSIYFSAPIINENNELLGVIRVRFNAAILQALIRDLDNLAGMESFGALFDENHIYLAHGNETDLLYRLAHSISLSRINELSAQNRLPEFSDHSFYNAEGQLSPEDIAINLEGGISRETLERYTIANQNVHNHDNEHDHADHRMAIESLTVKDLSTGDGFNQVVLIPLHEAPWVLAMYLSEDIFLAPIRTQTRNISIVAGVLGLVLTLSALAFANVLTKPIINLKKVAQQIEAGDLKAKVNATSNDEIGQLGDAFDDVTTKLTYYIEELEAEKQKEHAAAKLAQERMLSLLQATFDSTADGILVTDRRGEIVQVNAKLVELWALPNSVLSAIENLTPTHFVDRLQDANRFSALTNQLIQQPNLSATETFNLKSGATFELFTQPQKRGTEIIGRVWSFRDVTTREQHAQTLQNQKQLLAQQVAEQTAEIRAANVELAKIAKSKDEFLASMSHELRTPLSAILGNTEMLREKILGSISERQDDSLRMIESSGTHLLSLINDILDLAKVGAGNLVLEIRPTFVKDVVLSSLEMVRPTAQRKRLNVFVDLDPSVKVLNVDPRRFKQILVNLVTNAVKFTPDDGKVGVKVVGDADNQVARFMVWDTGIGIAQEDLDKLFKPFSQLDSKLSRRYEGTGLGLSLAYHMVELHGGNIKVTSQLEKGSLFTVTVPWTPEPIVTKSAPTPVKENPSPKRPEQIATPLESQPTLLIVDDNEINLTTFTDYLHAKGYIVHNARDGAEAVHLATSLLPDLILMDIQMPGMDGLEATRRIRQVATLQTTPIIALTALAMPSDRELCMKAGASDYVSKPVSLNKLASIVQVSLSTTGALTNPDGSPRLH